ncbi:MAG TPA: DUF3152 domain-containing protein [Acidimicrobiales bacterium]|nr:DUF3152 domain-containing protein [Acidimicrobiales bacterium]
MAVVATACTRAPVATAPAPAPTTTASTTSTTTTGVTTTAPAPAAVTIAYRLENHAGLAGFEAVVDETLHDARGWGRAGFRFVRDDSAGAPYRIVLGEPDEVQALCRPYDVFRTYSCQLGPVVALNAERWRHATPQWTGDLDAYRRMLVDHEVGHLLGLKHPPDPCPVRGHPARVMAQQSTELRGCVPNPWPLTDEVARAARHDLPLAPGYERP